MEIQYKKVFKESAKAAENSVAKLYAEKVASKRSALFNGSVVGELLYTFSVQFWLTITGIATNSFVNFSEAGI